jgi:hypothetical protein
MARVTMGERTFVGAINAHSSEPEIAPPLMITHVLQCADPAKVGPDRRNYLDSGLAEACIGVGVSVVSEDDAGRNANQVGTVSGGRLAGASILRREPSIRDEDCRSVEHRITYRAQRPAPQDGPSTRATHISVPIAR